MGFEFPVLSSEFGVIRHGPIVAAFLFEYVGIPVRLFDAQDSSLKIDVRRRPLRRNTSTDFFPDTAPQGPIVFQDC